MALGGDQLADMVAFGAERLAGFRVGLVARTQVRRDRAGLVQQVPEQRRVDFLTVAIGEVHLAIGVHQDAIFEVQIALEIGADIADHPGVVIFHGRAFYGLVPDGNRRHQQRMVVGHLVEALPDEAFFPGARQAVRLIRPDPETTDQGTDRHNDDRGHRGQQFDFTGTSFHSCLILRKCNQPTGFTQQVLN